jgi:hypothetical protein
MTKDNPNSSRISRQLIDEALDALWEVVAKHFPEAQTGDLSPWATIKLSDAVEEAIEEWVDNNVPQMLSR